MRKGRLSREEKENQEADAFARALLMPEEMITAHYKKFHSKYDLETTVKKLRQIFQVSDVQVTVRLRDLKLI